MPFAGNKDAKALSIKFRYRRCCVSVIMRPAGYLIRPHVTHGASWVWAPAPKQCFPTGCHLRYSGMPRANTFFNASLKNAICKCHQTFKEISMSSPLGAANYISLLWGNASQKRLGNAALESTEQELLCGIDTILPVSWTNSPRENWKTAILSSRIAALDNRHRNLYCVSTLSKPGITIFFETASYFLCTEG